MTDLYVVPGLFVAGVLLSLLVANILSAKAPCPACGKRSLKIYSKDSQEYFYFKCANCGARYRKAGPFGRMEDAGDRQYNGQFTEAARRQFLEQNW